jgi:hypothetical protein
MIPQRIIGATRYLGAPKDWVPEEHGDCAHLSIRDEPTRAGNAMTSSWEPTPEELAILNAGGRVCLSIWGEVHPPVWVQAVAAG